MYVRGMVYVYLKVVCLTLIHGDTFLYVSYVCLIHYRAVIVCKCKFPYTVLWLHQCYMKPCRATQLCLAHKISGFKISKIIYWDFLSDFSEDVQDFRVFGDLSVGGWSDSSSVFNGYLGTLYTNRIASTLKAANTK